jgi:hypothetical protein
MKSLFILIAPLVLCFAACTKEETTAQPETEDTTATEKPKVKAPPDEMGSEVYYFTDSSYLRSNSGVVEEEESKTIATTETATLNKTKDQINIRGHVHHREPGTSKWANTGRIGTTTDYFYSEVTKDGKTVRYYFTATSGGIKTEIRVKGEIL